MLHPQALKDHRLTEISSVIQLSFEKMNTARASSFLLFEAGIFTPLV